MGFSAEGINREVSSTLECASLCRKHKTSKSLAIPETAIFKLASGIPSRKNQRCYQKPLFSVPAAAYNELRPTWKDIARGILPSLRYVVKRDCHKQWDGCESTKHRRDQGVLLHVDKVPDSHCDAFEHPIDPFGNDYFCKLCDQELSNSYFHCNGCEKLLAKDFNICSQCFEEREFLQNINMSKVTTTAMASNFHHMGKNLGKCTCQRPGACLECQKCMICTCNCHKVFYKRFRFYTEWRQEELLEYCGELVGDDEIQFARETECRLNGEGMVPESDDVVQPHRAQCRLQSVLELRLERVSAMMPAGSGDQTDAENSDRKLLAAYEYVTRRPTLVPDVNGQKRGSCVQDVVVNSRDHGQGQQHY